MTLAGISLAYLRSRPLASALNLLLLALGVATITVLLLATEQLESRMGRDARGIDLVAGAKGSPMQLVLSAVFHLDAPTGNIPLADANALAKNRMVKKAIPLALGDSYKSFRIVGSSHEYPAHYGARVADGRLWNAPMEATLGAEVAARTKLAVGAKFAGAHGLGEGGDEHDKEPYQVVGVLAPTGTVLDRLVLTSVESVWEVHEHGAPANAPKEITALLIQYASPLAAAMLPRFVNSSSALQAASPAYESARLFRMIGVGVDVLRAFGVILMLAAGLSVFIALLNALEERRYDLAVMRMLGATPARLMGLMLLEGCVLALAGGIAGIALGHVFAEVLGAALRQAQQSAVTGWAWSENEWWLLAASLGVGVVAALIPAWRAYRSDVAPVLAEG
ncbi:MAG TPA: ABC transporter permease [Burkholderiales bacterium]|jgi:putative ABC transport system permease protein|nr:ABC transporter permease [Burkholderiales bacterium]